MGVRLIEVYSKDTLPIEEGSLLKYITSDYKYRIEEPKYGHVFQVIGNPADEYDNTEVTYTFSTTTEPYKTKIKVIK